MTEPRTPRTEAGSPTICRCGLAKSYHEERFHPDHAYEPRYEPTAWREGYRRGYKHGYEAAKREDPHSMLRAGAAPPIDVERLADALTAAPSLLLEGDDRDRKEFAEWLLSRLSGPPSGGTDHE